MTKCFFFFVFFFNIHSDPDLAPRTFHELARDIHTGKIKSTGGGCNATESAF